MGSLAFSSSAYRLGLLVHDLIFGEFSELFAAFSYLWRRRIKQSQIGKSSK
jgi:hypothetical protein